MAKTDIFDNGVLVNTEYTGTLAENKAERIDEIKAAAWALIDATYEDRELAVAAHGINPGTGDTAIEVGSKLQAVRNRAASLIQSVNACTTNEQVWAVDVQFNNLTFTPVPNRWIRVGKAANQTVTNSAVLVTDSELTFPMLANTKYSVRGMIFFDTTANGDFKYTIQGPANPTGVRFSPTTAPGGTAPSMAAVTNAYPAAAGVALLGGGANGFVQVDMIVHNGNTAGDFIFRFAQNTATAGQSATVIAGSYIEYAVV